MCILISKTYFNDIKSYLSMTSSNISNHIQHITSYLIFQWHLKNATTHLPLFCITSDKTNVFIPSHNIFKETCAWSISSALASCQPNKQLITKGPKKKVKDTQLDALRYPFSNSSYCNDIQLLCVWFHGFVEQCYL